MDIVGAFFVGLAATFLGSISSGANLISVPGLIFLGVPPVSAIATSRIAALGGGIGTALRYHKEGKILWRYVPLFGAIALIGGLLGPKLLLLLDRELVEPIVGVLLIACLPLLFLKRSFGEVRVTTSRRRQAVGLIVLLVVMAYSTAFAAGGGVFLLYALAYFFGLTLTEGVATGNVIWAFGSAVALVAYAANGEVLYLMGIVMALGAAIGGYLGARLAVKKGLRWVKYVLAAVIVVSGVKLIFF